MQANMDELVHMKLEGKMAELSARDRDLGALAVKTLAEHLEMPSDAIQIDSVRAVEWRDSLLYEYYWEWNFPATPTVFAIRGERYKYIYYHGVWDRNGLYEMSPILRWCLRLIWKKKRKIT